MISQKENSTNIVDASTNIVDAVTYAEKCRQLMTSIGQAEDYVAVNTNGVSHRENVWNAHQGNMVGQLSDVSVSLNELVARVRYLTKEVRYLREIMDAKSLLLDASIEEIYGDKI